MAPLALDDEVLLSGDDGLLGLEVSQVCGVEVSGSSALSQEDLSLGGGVSVEPWSGELLDGKLSGSVSLGPGEGGGGGHTEVAAEELLLGPDDLLGSRDVRDLQEAGDGVTVGIVGAGGSGEASGELRGGQGQGGEREEDEGLHV